MHAIHALRSVWAFSTGAAHAAALPCLPVSGQISPVLSQWPFRTFVWMFSDC